MSVPFSKDLTPSPYLLRGSLKCLHPPQIFEEAVFISVDLLAFTHYKCPSLFFAPICDLFHYFNISSTFALVHFPFNKVTSVQRKTNLLQNTLFPI